MRKFALFFAAFIVAGCSYDPCADRGTRAAWIAGGGPVGLVAALALSCEAEAPRNAAQIAAVPSAGLVALPEAPLDMAEPAPDLTPPPDLTQPDRDGDGVPDAKDRCPGTPAGDSPDPSTNRRGCPAPGYYDVGGKLLHAESGSWSVLDNVWKSVPVYDWQAFRPVPSVLTMRVDLAQSDPAQLTIHDFSWTGAVDMGAPTTRPECLPLKNQGLYDFPASPADPTLHTCELRTLSARIYDERDQPLGGGADCAPLPGLHLVSCTMAFGVRVPLPAGARYFQVKFLATGAISLSDVEVKAKIESALL